METTVPILIGLSAVMLLCMGAVLDDRRARVRRREQHEELEVALPLLHSINDDRCIGCEACVDVCPTEVLDLVDHKVRVARFSDCVQCEQCANACPTQALVMYREGTTPRMLTVPELDEHFQTGVPGQYLIGEVAGKPLVKNAANLGRAVIEHIVRDLAGRPAAGHGVIDVAIVGSGPGGLSAGLTCIKHKLSCLVLEKEHIISSTVSRYPKGKHFMAEPCTSQNVSYLPVFDGAKEELVAAWTQVVEGAKLPIKLGEAVETVARGDDGVFTIKTTVGTYKARTVVLATGLRGKPRLLVVPGANLEKVQSLLDDPAEFAGEHVLVVGGGDSAVEGAMSLTDVGATVTLSYRGDGFKRCKQGNQKRLAELVASKRLSVLLESNVSCFTPDSVTIKLADKTETTIPNQRAFVLIGADTPVAWLETNNVRFVERPHMYALGSTEDVVRRLAPGATECPHTAAEALAILLDRPAPRAPVQRMRSVVEHLRDEFREVVTSVSSAFRLSDLEAQHARRNLTRTPARGVPAMRQSTRVIPASRLTAGRPGTEPAAGGVKPGLFGPEPTVTAHAIRPRSAPRRASSRIGNETQRGLPALYSNPTTDQVPSLRALELAASRANPFEPRTDEIASLRHALDQTTDETASLRARERQAQQIAALRRAHEARTEEVASLRTLERALGDPAAAPPAEPLDGATDEIRSLRVIGDSTESLPTIVGAIPEAPNPWSPPVAERKAAAGPRPRQLRSATELAAAGLISAGAGQVPERRPPSTGAPVARPAAVPPPVPPRAFASATAAPAMGRGVAQHAVAAHPAAVPPPPRRTPTTPTTPTTRPPRLARGSASLAQRDALPDEPSGDDAAAPRDHRVVR